MIIEKIKSTIIANKLFKPKERVLVCVSGGPDSVFLLDILTRLKELYALRISVAHLNHCLRGQESDADEVFVSQLADGYGMSFFRARVDVAKLAKQKKISIEQAARFARYNFFSNICQTQKIKKIVLAHTKDDQVETILMRILRGTGIKGLGGIKFLSELDNMLLVRPLLDIEKQQILSYLKKNKLKFRVDSSNQEKNYFRNKVRLDVLPLLEQLSPGLKDNIVRIADNAQKTENFIQAKLNPIYQRIIFSIKNNEIIIYRQKFLKLMPIIRSEIIRKAIFSLSGDINGIDYKHIRIIDDFAGINVLSGQGLDLPKSLQVGRTRQYLKFSLKKKSKISVLENQKFLLELNKELIIKSLGYSFKVIKLKGKINIKKKLPGIEYLDFAVVKFPLIVRTWLSGDRFKPLGNIGSQKIKKFLIDQKIDKDLKQKIPLVLSGNKIILVGGMRIADDFKVTKQTKNILKIIIKRIK
ncbi:MAG: tRNA lysidine(34) synthetase TilS [Candidatus Omnitrophica bacterium]|nr:tRNA lysidine(34) synthetase TilS [Candidatus Omnitrophota bacterium]